VQLDIQIENIDDTVVDVKKLKVQIPVGLKILDKGELAADMTWKGDISDMQNFTLILQGYRTGAHVITVDIEFEQEGFVQSISDKKTVTVKQDVFADLVENLDDKEDLFTAEVYSDIAPVYNIDAEIISDLFSTIMLRKDRIGVKNIFQILDYDPSEAPPGIHYVNITVIYENEIGEKFYLEKSHEFTVKEARAKKQIKEEEVPENVEGPEQEQNIVESFMPKDQEQRSGIIIISAVVGVALLLLFLKYKVRS